MHHQQGAALRAVLAASLSLISQRGDVRPHHHWCTCRMHVPVMACVVTPTQPAHFCLGEGALRASMKREERVIGDSFGGCVGGEREALGEACVLHATRRARTNLARDLDHHQLLSSQAPGRTHRPRLQPLRPRQLGHLVSPFLLSLVLVDTGFSLIHSSIPRKSIRTSIMHHTAWTKKAASSLPSDRIPPRTQTPPQTKAKAKGKQKENTPPKSKEVRALEKLRDDLRKASGRERDPKGGCFCQGVCRCSDFTVPMSRHLLLAGIHAL